MELKAKEKPTEQEAMPKDWDYGPIGERIDLLTGYPFPSEDYTNSGVRLLRGSNVKRGVIDWSDDISQFWSDVAPDIARYELNPGDLVIAMDGALVGRSFAQVAEGDIPALLLQRVARIRSEEIEIDYLAQFFYNQSFAEHCDSVKTNTAIPHISPDDIRSFAIPLPPAREQRAIAAALLDADTLIAKSDALIAKKRAIKTATMQRLLTGKQRLPDFSGAWETKRLIDLVDHQKNRFEDGDWVESEYITKSGIRLIQTGNIGEGRFRDKTEKKYISDNSFVTLNCKEVKPGDILICRLAEPAGRACIMPDLGEQKMITAVDVTIFRPLAEHADQRYLLHLFSTKSWFDEVELRSGGSTRSRIARRALGRIELTLPPVEEQQAIAGILSGMDAEIETLEARRDKTRAIKQGMMQELLTGRTRLV